MAPQYRPPTFNLLCGIWRAGNPTSNPPDVISACNLALGRRAGVLLGGSDAGAFDVGGMWLLLPAGTDVRDKKDPGGAADKVECPYLSGRYYNVLWVDDAGGGFPNEHRFAEIQSFGPWPVPFPTPTTIPPINPLTSFGVAQVNAVAVPWLAYNFVAPSTMLAFVVFSEGTNGPPTFATGTGAPLVHRGSYGILNAHLSAYTVLSIYTLVSLGPETITLTGFTANTLQCNLIDTGCNNFDQVNFSTGSSQPEYVTSYGPLAGYSETLLSVFAQWDTAGSSSVSLPYVPVTVQDVVLNDTFGAAIRTAVGNTIATNNSLQLAQCVGNPGTFFYDIAAHVAFY